MSRRGKSRNLWGALVLSVFLILLCNGILMFGLSMLIVKSGLIDVGRFHIFWLVSVLLLASVLTGTAITAIVGRKLLAPINDLSDAAKRVAKGDFGARVAYEDHKVDVIGEMAVNFNSMVHELGSMETLRNDFIVNVSHEFKTPIAAIEGYATLMQDQELTPEERADYSRLIIESTRQLSSLSSNILKLAKLENQEIVGGKTEFALDEQLRQALLLLEAQWNDKRINLDLTLEPVVYYGNEELLMQVWLNLLVNAFKFTDNGGEVAVSLLDTGADIIMVQISDSGTGMTEEVMKRIFEKFYQGDKSRSAEGNGLGLPLVRRIVELSGGSVSVESTPGKGSVFTVRLPV
ncbi:HAMP domain-containing sensor histidine kinase [Paenibacillus typhae]|uniref:histidine kinase n=1 Tax=Paenibacillus typhae TaxID=1174501 RepID=A0A1G8JEH1_9BACL|nr:HAMP domain-containing sensor histidine kinase [Paenibacillus typhae]SDI29441.1 Signal transduction histidine kinase [Paenibacillus typhae]